ncbi:MAG: hypothetical protein M1831_002911 [Alyxoria varia]|nr:MAG: hypothetical protein M1831_002911 [Alyxoria varia]
MIHHGHVVHSVELRTHAQLGAHSGRLSEKRSSSHDNITVVVAWGSVATNEKDEGWFAGAVGAEKREFLRIVDAESDVLDCGVSAELLG